MSNDDDREERHGLRKGISMERHAVIDQLALSFQREAYLRVLAAATGSLMRSETMPPYDVQALANDAAKLAADSADKWFRENLAF